ncbi:hypothetical protein ONS95_010489 [Cadophora gregata]|uniref:uncharacterized protein n=1 Tax=Cadophora gregata TaxID=51156 RepID=UPI0026DB6088|nr:uncharacterized protein ONS95_010489 [Cadophora gregata]KAK0122236.1 hypothetical protein ONS95_010489 [Cadophora gregata]KAK0127714.1 hypothetical protein ONS96_007229 [Cadophora gregata f. sp. sojae]
MRRSASNKENIAPKALTEQPDNPRQNRCETGDFEKTDGFVEVSPASGNNQIDQSPSSNSRGTTSTIINKGRDVDRTDDIQDLEMAESDLDGVGSMESMHMVGLDDVGLEELLEIEEENPDDLGPLDAPDRPITPFEGESFRGQPLAEVDPNDLPAPLKVNKSSYFSKDNPMKAEAQFEDVPDDLDDWFEEGEVDEDGIRREEVEVSFAEWNLERHPRFGRYRVKTVSGLRVSWTIDDYYTD